MGSVNHKASGQDSWATAHKCGKNYRAGHSALSVPSGTAGRAQNAGVFDSIAECFTA